MATRPRRMASTPRACAAAAFRRMPSPRSAARTRRSTSPGSSSKRRRPSWRRPPASSRSSSRSCASSRHPAAASFADRDVSAATASRIALVAGEASGDLLGAELIRALRARAPHLEFYGVGGPRMKAMGCDVLVDASALAVRGLTEVLAHLPRLVRLRRALYRRFARDRPALFIGIDAPDFNLGLEARLKRRGVRTLHYVSPSVWAWRSERIQKIGRAADRILTLFPFEHDLYAGAGVRATYVGHPLADRAPLDDQRRERRLQRQLTRTQPVVALLPGSRTGELAMHASLFVDVARLFHAREPEAHFLVPLVNRETRT